MYPRTQMPQAIDESFNEAARRLDAIRGVLATLATVAVKRDPRSQVAWAGQKASIYVWLAACMEDFLKRFLRLLLQDISASRPKCQDLRVEILAIAVGPNFERLEAVRKLKKWRDRVAIMQQVVDSQDAVLLDAHLPIDGRTIEPEHLEIVWLVFGLPRSPFPGLVQKMALLDISRGRNQVAHGELKPEELGRSKNVSDLLRLVSHVEDLVQHVYMAGLDYLASDGYRR